MTADLKIENDSVVATGKLVAEDGFVGKDDQGWFMNASREMGQDVTLRLRANAGNDANLVLENVSGRTGGNVKRSVYGHDGLFTHEVNCHELRAQRTVKTTSAVLGSVPMPGEEDENPGGRLEVLGKDGDPALLLNGETGVAYAEQGMTLFLSGSSNPDRPVLSHSPAHTAWGLWYRDRGDAFLFQKPGQVVMSVDLGGAKVGIGTDKPQHSLHVEGTVAGRGQFLSLSDVAAKTDIEPLAGALDTVGRLRGVSFRWNDAASADTEREVGLIAQEVAVVVPEAVADFDDGRKGVAYGSLVPVLIEAIKELRAKVATLEARLAAAD